MYTVRQKGKNTSVPKIWRVLMLMVLLLGGCAVNPVTGEQDFVLMSESEELALGLKTSRQVMKEYRRYDNSRLQRYVQSVGDRVARVSHRKNLPYQFTLLDSNEVNAFALPGGHIYITRGLLVYLNSEAELAAVLGHELGHVTARHSVRQHSLSTTTNVLGNIIAIASGVQGVGQLTNLLGTGIVRGYGREHELEADGLGVEYLVKAGYPASAMRKVISTLKNQEVFDRQLALEQGRKPRTYHGVFATHPDNDTRLQQVLGNVGVLATDERRKSQQDKVFLKRLVGLTFGDSAEDGVIRGNTFYHEDLNFKITFPAGWSIANRPDAILASAPQGEALVQLTLKMLKKDMTPKQFMTERLGVNKSLHEVHLSVGGLEGYTAVIDGKTPYGKGKLRMTVLVDKRRAFVFFTAVKQANKFSHFDMQVHQSINSFSTLSHRDKKVAAERKLSLIRVGRVNQSLQRAIRNSRIEDHAEEQIRLLNDLFPTGRPKLGDLIKIVR